MSKASIFGDLTIEQFLTEYWQKKPLLVKGAFKDFDFPVDADELAGMACEADVESRFISQGANGDNWQLKHGPLNEEFFATLPESHWTLLVQAVDHWVPDANELMEAFNFLPSWRLDDLMISYAAQGGGVGPHYDNYDVFLIQADGQRRWEVGGLYGEDSPRREDTPVMILPEWHAEQSWDLEPGDMLYLPPRVGHNGISLDNECVTYSVGFRAPSHTELYQNFARFLGDNIPGELRYADPDHKRQTHSAEIDQASIERLQNTMRHYIDNPTLLAQWFGEYMTDPKYPEQQQANSDTPAVKPGDMLARNEGSRLAFVDQPGMTPLLFADGKSYEFEPASLPLIQQLTEQVDFEVPEQASTEFCALLSQLVNQGSLYVDDVFEL